MKIKAFVFDAYGTLYDVQSISRVIDAAFPGHGEYITQVWRLKQLEYSWLRSLMGHYQDFLSVSRESLEYTLGTLGLAAEKALVARLIDAYNNLSPYPEAKEALAALRNYRRAILSNGSPGMLDALVRNTGFDSSLDAVISVDTNKVFKPDPRAYELIPARLNLCPEEVVFVSSNGFDVAGARSFGFNVAQIERVTPAALRGELLSGVNIGPAAIYRALRTQTETLGLPAHAVVDSLLALPGLVEAFER